MKNLTIGQLARETGISIETIRYYERCGLITIPPRRESGYREFTHKYIGQINFIKEAKTKGFTLKEVAKLRVLVEKKRNKRNIHKFIEVKIQNIGSSISDLTKMRESLQHMLKTCLSGKSLDDCRLCNLIKS